MKRYYYVGLDIHKKVIAYCVKKADGNVVDEGKIRASRSALTKWNDAEATMGGRYGSDSIHGLDLRFSLTPCKRTEGGPSFETSGHRGGQEEK